MRRLSWYHITTRSVFLAAALILSLALWYLPNFLELDEFRPPVLDLLQKAFHCHVMIGNIRGELVPYPGLVVGHVVFLKEGKTPRVLASMNGVHLWLSIKTLDGRLRFRAIRFNRPRFIVHREAGSWDENQWTLLSLPDNRGGGSLLGDEWQIRSGSIEYWDHTTVPTSKWVANQFNGSFLTRSQSGAMIGKIPRLGRRATLDLHYRGSAAFPIEARLSAVEPDAIQKWMHVQVPALENTAADFLVKARFQPDLAVQATLAPVFLAGANGERLRAHASLEKGHLHFYLQTLAVEPMTVVIDGDLGQTSWKAQAAVTGYDAAFVRNFYAQSWVDRLEGPGTLEAQAQSGPGGWSGSATGKGFRLENSALRLPEWSAQGDDRHLSVVVHGTTPQGGATEVTWALPTGSTDASLYVEASSVTLRQVLEVFNLQSKPESVSAVKPESAMNPYGYEPWLITQGSLQAIVHDGTAFEIQHSRFVISGMPVNLRGTFELTHANPQARIQGEVQNIAMAPTVESFFKPPSPITGSGRLNFSLTFPMSGRWINGLSGPIQLEIDNGLVRELKTIYRIMSVLNLGNYLRLRFPQITARGIQFQTLIGHLTFQNGVLSSEDLFLKGPNMNVGAKGSLDIPGQRIKLTLRLEMFRFLEDILKDVPITHWIFKKPSKILLPLVVAVEGPWSDVGFR